MSNSIQFKDFKFTTRNQEGEDVKTYTTSQLNVKDARRYASQIVANSNSNEMSHSRVVLAS